jgi:hypothetical protein
MSGGLKKTPSGATEQVCASVPAPDSFIISGVPEQRTSRPFRPADPGNLPRQEARRRFLDTLANHSTVLRQLFGKPLRVWKSLSPAAAKLCAWDSHVPWFSILYAPQYKDLDPRGDPAEIETKNAHLELLPLRELLITFASKHGLMYQGAPAVWAMQTVIETLDARARYPKSKTTRRWTHELIMSEEYPALIESGWRNAVRDSPEEELFTIVIDVAPKQPAESFKQLEKRFNAKCREVRRDYVRRLKASKWRTSVLKQLKAVDRLAKWQATPSTSKVDPSIKTPNQRAAFSRDLQRAADYIGITRRVSGHDPKLRHRH